MELTKAIKGRIKFHLGYNDTTPSGEVFWADRQLAKGYEEQVIRLIKKNLDGLDQVYALMTDVDNVTRTEAIIGDVNRTITNTDIDPAKLRKRYTNQGDLLAESLGISNMRGKDKDQFRRGDSGIINYLTRADGSSVGSRLMMADFWS
jgi:hypothetical protein